MDVRAEWPPFSALPGIWLVPFFNKNDPIFLDSYVKSPTFLTSWYLHIFFAPRFFDATCSLGIQWTDCDICLTTSNKWVQKIKGQYMNRSTFWMIEYMNGSVFSKARHMNGVDFEILARTPVPQLPPSYPATPPPPPPPPLRIFPILVSSQCFILFTRFLVDCLQSCHSIQTPKILKVAVHVLIIDQCIKTAR